MVTHVLLLKLHPEEAISTRRHWVQEQARLFFDEFPQSCFTWKTPIADDLQKWDGLILIEGQDLEEIQGILESSSYHNWLTQINPFLACIKGWSFTS